MAYLNQSASTIATDALKAIPFENIIGAPLMACIKAQKMAAESSVDFIDAVGLNEVPLLDEKGNPVKTKAADGSEHNVMVKKAVYVTFEFIQQGRLVRLSIPLLTIVPIPYIAINTIDINFKANISAMSAVSEEENEEDKTSTYNSSQDSSRKGWRISKNQTKRSSYMNASISSKKDSKGTSESKYSVEYTMDVAVHASQDSMPAGMAKVLELLGSALDLCSTEGEFITNNTTFLLPKKAGEGTNSEVVLEASYKGPDGLMTGYGFELYNKDNKPTNAEREKYKAIFKINQPGSYILKTNNGETSLKIEAKNSTTTNP